VIRVSILVQGGASGAAPLSRWPGRAASGRSPASERHTTSVEPPVEDPTATCNADPSRSEDGGTGTGPYETTKR